MMYRWEGFVRLMGIIHGLRSSDRNKKTCRAVTVRRCYRNLRPAKAEVMAVITTVFCRAVN